MSNTKVVQISGVARPAPSAMRRLALMGKLGHLSKRDPGVVDAMLESSAAVDALARVLDKAMTESVSADGRLDLKDMAARVLRSMKEG